MNDCVNCTEKVMLRDWAEDMSERAKHNGLMWIKEKDNADNWKSRLIISNVCWFFFWIITLSISIGVIK